MPTQTYSVTITLATGEQHTFSSARKPRHAASWAIQQLPYGTPMQGATFAMSWR